MSGVMLLSKFPLDNAQQYVLAATWNRRIILRATAKIENGASVDVYCNHLTEVYSQVAFPYTGFYGKGQTDSKGWENELMLQSQRLAQWVDARSGVGRAIVLGDFNAGPELKDFAVEPVAAAEFIFLSGKFPEALAAGYKPACSSCSKEGNILAASGTSPNAWVDHIFLKAIPTSAVKSSSRTHVDPVVPVTTAVDGGALGTGPSMVPLSDHYGIRAVISITP
jgi:endonuclease/exonuclease/phosphatase family metal-dependent hydrolase